jgi:hypothetical protein
MSKCEWAAKVEEELGWYVYALKDPRDGQVFYIGKGKGDRVFQHACYAGRWSCPKAGGCRRRQRSASSEIKARTDAIPTVILRRRSGEAATVPSRRPAGLPALAKTAGADFA